MASETYLGGTELWAFTGIGQLDRVRARVRVCQHHNRKTEIIIKWLVRLTWASNYASPYLVISNRSIYS